MCTSDPRVWFNFFLITFILALPVAGQQAEDSRIFKMAWDLPTYAKDHSCAKKYLWSEANTLGDLYVLFSKTRNATKGDEEAFAGYASFRPFALDFKDFSCAFGVSFTGAMGKFEEGNAEEQEDVDIGNLIPKMRPGSITLKKADGYSIQSAVSFSTLTSFPKQGLQIVMDIGFAWTKLKATGDINAKVLEYFNSDPNQPLFYYVDTIDDYTYMQRNNGVYLSLEIRKFFERSYLNYFSFMVYGIRKIETDSRESTGIVTGKLTDLNGNPFPIIDSLGRVKLPTTLWKDVFFEHELPDPQEGDFNGSFIGGSLVARLIGFPVDVGELIKNQDISLDALFGLEHTAGELLGADFHGIGVNVGGQISLLEVVSVAFTYTFQRNNDLDDEWDVTLVLGLH
jgi:hypothetical protein